MSDLTEAERALIAEALLHYANALLRTSRSRKWAGPDCADIRAQMRNDAAHLRQIASKITRQQA